MNPGHLELKQVNLRGRQLLADAVPPQRRTLTTWLRARALRRLQADVELQGQAALAAYARGDLRGFRELAGVARELDAQREVIASGTSSPIDATDVWRAITVLAALFWGGVLLYFFTL